MANLGNFDASQVEPAMGFDPIPVGQYLAVITESEFKPTKAGDGHYLQLTFEILDGQHKSRKLWSRLNLDNKNETAVEIARSELSSICRSTGVVRPADSCELHNLPVTITVKCKKRSDTGEIANEIAKYESKDALRGVTQQAASGAPPWQRPTPSEVPF